MADLTEMYRFAAQSIPGYGDFAKGAAASQELMNNQLAYQKAKEDLEAQRGLRALFQQNPNAGYSDVAQYSPALAQEMMKNQFATSKDLLEMQKTKSEIAEKQFKLTGDQEKELGQAHGAVVEAYDQLISRGVDPQQASMMVAPLAGQLTAQLAQRGIQTSQSFDPSMITPQSIESMRLSARKHGFPLTQDKLYQSQQEALVPQRPSYGDVAGRTEAGPAGPRYIPPVSQVTQPRGAIPTPSIEFEGKTYTGPQFAKAIMAETDPARRAKMNEYIDAAMASEQQGIPNAQFVTPEQEREFKAKEASAIEQAKEVTKAEVGREEEGKRITDAFKRAMGEGGVSRVMNLIAGSTSGKGEELLAKTAGAIPGVGATAGMENIGALNTIAGELRKTIERSPGPQSDKDVALAALDAAAIADPAIPYNQRMKGFLEFTRIIKERAKDLGIDPKELGIDVDTASGSSLPTAKTDAEADALVKTLKPGQSFIGPDGKTHKIKGM